MITEEHFAALRSVREAAAELRLACIVAEETGSLLHLAFDRDVTLRPSKRESALLGKIRAIQ